MHGDGASGAAKRWRERRLRSWWRHEAHTIQAAVVSALHHSRDVGAREERSPTGTEEDHRGGGGRVRDAIRLMGIDVPASGDAACQPGRAGRVSRGHTVEQFGELAPTVQILDAPVPQSGDQLVDKIKNDVEQAIEVPKIFLLDYTPQRAVLGVPQLVEQLVDVPVPVWTELTRDRDAAGRVWCRIAAYGGRQGIFLWQVGYSTLPLAHPAGDHRQQG